MHPSFRVAVLPALSLVALAASVSAQPARAVAVPAPSCREGFACPGAAGRVDVTLAGFDGSGATGDAPGFLDSDEIQCALDCLDGHPDPDHVLSGPKAPRTATPVRGGLITFDASATYRIQRSLNLPAVTDGALIVDGQGARLTIKRADPAPIAVFQRVAPPGANNCDVEQMAIWASMWTFENLSIAGDGSPQDTGIVLHGTNSLNIRNCWFASLGIGVDLRFALVPHVEQSAFLNNRRHDIILGDGLEECGPTGRCYETCTTGPAVFTGIGQGTQKLHEGGCNTPLISHCRFLMHSQQLSSVRIRASRAPVVNGPVFDGVRGRHAIHHSHTLANDLAVRDMYFETSVERPEALIRFDGGSRLLVEGMQIVTGQQTLAVDASENAGATIILRAIPWMPKEIRFSNGTNPWRNQWRMEDVAGGDLGSPSRWTGGPPPLALVVDDVRQELRPSSSASGAMSVPVGSPQERGEKLQDGQIWIDKATKRLMFCCDSAGRPKAASR